MSDIGFDGVFAFLAGLVMLAVAGAGLVIEPILLHRRWAGSSLGLALLGPALYGLVAVVVLYIAEEASVAWKSRLDAGALPLALLGLLPWILIRRYRRRQRKADLADA